MCKWRKEDKAGQRNRQDKWMSFALPLMVCCTCASGLAGCGGTDEAASAEASVEETASPGENEASRGYGIPEGSVADGDGNIGNPSDAVRFDHELDGYEPMKKEYNFYFTYKIVHPWWDAVALGMEDAAEQYGEMGITINYEYLAPNSVSAEDQAGRLEDAYERGFDVLGVDVADVETITPVINRLMEDGQKVMTFSSSDAAKEDGCSRIAYVGNTHNYGDGAELTEALCEKLGYEGKVAILVGTEGAPCHEDRALGAQDVIAKYPGMEIVEIAYDEDSVEKAYGFTKGFLADYDDLAGMVCCNMSNPVGAARAVIEEGRENEVLIVGMDHDQEALQYLKDGIIYALGVQDCYSIGFDTMQVAVKIADGHLPGDAYPEKTEETTTVIYQDGAAAMLRTLYGEMD